MSAVGKVNPNERATGVLDSKGMSSHLDFRQLPGMDLSWADHLPRLQRNGELVRNNLTRFSAMVRWHAIKQRRPLYEFSKWVADRILGAFALLVALPLILAIAVLIKLDSPGPIFYRQLRLGRYGKPFYIWKFRTMFVDADKHLIHLRNEIKGGFFKVQADTRITRMGRILRRSSLDELPQFWNVAIGAMSLVGPRALAVYDCLAVPEDLVDRFAVPQGLTGLWQVTARDSNDGVANFRIDAAYVEQRGWRLDLWILLKTIPAVLSGRGAR